MVISFKDVYNLITHFRLNLDKYRELTGLAHHTTTRCAQERTQRHANMTGILNLSSKVLNLVNVVFSGTVLILPTTKCPAYASVWPDGP